jgi:hypothetical protein
VPPLLHFLRVSPKARALATKPSIRVSLIRAGNVFLVSEKRTVNGVESLPRIGVLYGTAGAWKTSAVRMGDTREYA